MCCLHWRRFDANLPFDIRIDESDVKRRELGVMFDDLKVVGLGASASYQDTLGSILNPSNLLGTFKAMRHPAARDILSGFEGVVRPGEMLRMCLVSPSTFAYDANVAVPVVLGRPGSGCSTLLKTLANQRKEYHAISGEVHYDSFSPETLAKHYRGDVIYCPEDDVHFPTLTVDQTLRFAAKTRAPRTLIAGQTQAQYVQSMVDVVETVFGLRHVKDTPVGDNRIRGVSGGQKKRVSIGEALVTRCKMGAWDKYV